MQEEYWVQKREAIQKSREEAKALKQAKKEQVVEKKEKKVLEPHYVAGTCFSRFIVFTSLVFFNSSNTSFKEAC